MDQTLEQWRPVVGYEGFYEVSDQGRVKSLGRRGEVRPGVWRSWEAKILKPQPGGRRNENRVHVRLSKDGKVDSFLVAHLVARAFIGPRPEGQLVLHGDKGRNDNSAANLYYGNHSRNNGADRWRDGTAIAGESNNKAKLTEAQVLEIRASSRRQVELAEEYGVRQGTISAIKRRRIWKHVA